MKKLDFSIISIIKIKVGIVLIFIVADILSSIFGFKNLFSAIIENFSLPINPEIFLRRPWTILTYFMVYTRAINLIFSMIFLYNASNLLSNFFRFKRIFSIYLLGNILTPIVVMVISRYLPSLSQNQGYLYGASQGILTLLAAAATFAPNYPINVLIFGVVRLKYVVLFYIIISFSQLNDFSNTYHLANIIGIAWGFVYIKLLNQGYDIAKPIISIINTVESRLKEKNEVRMKVIRKNKN